MSPNEQLTPAPRRKKASVAELEPAYGELRADYDHRRVQAELFQMFYFHASPADVEALLQQMFEIWLGSVHGAMATTESRRRNYAVVNDLCRIVRAAGVNKLKS